MTARSKLCKHCHSPACRLDAYWHSFNTERDYDAIRYWREAIDEEQVECEKRKKERAA